MYNRVEPTPHEWFIFWPYILAGASHNGLANHTTLLPQTGEQRSRKFLVRNPPFRSDSFFLSFFLFLFFFFFNF